jgi:hypothetical protein
MISNTNTNASRNTKLTIWQQNIYNSCTCQHDLISSSKLARRNIDVVALQKPLINFLNRTVASQDWKTIYPSTHEKQPMTTRSLMLIRDTILMDGWEQLDFPSRDITAIQIKGRWGTSMLFNIYNDCKHDNMIMLLTDYHRRHN